jgi:hypothetical protein
MFSNSSFSCPLFPKIFLMTSEFYFGEDRTKLSPEAKSKAFLYQGDKP